VRAGERVRGCVRSGVSEAADEMRSRARASGTLRVVHDDSRDWVAALRGPPALREEAVADLHSLLLRGARFELTRRRALLGDLPPGELDALASEAANDALLAILAKLDSFRGASRFTTWAYKFVLMEAGAGAQREAWHGREIDLAVTLPATLEALRDAVEESLTPHEREVFAALALNRVPIDVLAERLGTTRSALYATLRDAGGALRAATSRHGANLSHAD
jgi:RNA polymerase sigma-70 factor (ECF subfamily)